MTNPTYPHRHAVTAQEFLRMAAADVFATEMRLELMEGEIIEMPPIGSAHAAVVNSLAAILNARCGKEVIVSVQNPIVVGDQSVPQPDLALLRMRPDKYFHQHPTPADVLLVIEVSDTTLRFDLERKALLYAAAGMAETWGSARYTCSAVQRKVVTFSDRRSMSPRRLSRSRFRARPSPFRQCFPDAQVGFGSFGAPATLSVRSHCVTSLLRSSGTPRLRNA